MDTPDHNQNPKAAPPRRRKRIMLPFEKRKSDPGTWAYEHRVGLLVTVLVYLMFGIVFVSAKILIGRETRYHTILIDLGEVQPEPPKQLTPEERQRIEADLANVRNRVSNENATTEVDPNTEQSTARGYQDARIEQRNDAVGEQMRASRERYEKGLREEREMIEASRNRSSSSNNEPRQDVKVRGNVIISFSLAGRTATYLHKPAYQCEGGGEVIVNITVNRNGDVTAASISRTSSNDNCLTERALSSARISRFNVDPTAPERQQGTITYLFVPQ